ncbi:Fe-S cluster assembly protein SufD [Methylomarinovum caldicuralii]|uniref:Fe-S cluster assembly protein SufD n=1 Tax=Methylomarinovum caldicuralii TaxID=438856 RepID=A0AAU9CQ33_9GAMM|nr:Fe-S cluster assembly protein SufD [Methylomarinovum caldicuralii]BCX81612.1 Fe-S cluster assembly protein SufD [Methylomarinovum caldicuralii]
MTLPAEVIEPLRRHTDVLAENAPAWLAGLRRKALERFVACGFPSPREEEWRYTNVTPIARKRFPVAAESGQVDVAWVQQRLLADCWHLVFIDGHFHRDLSHPALAGDVILCDLDSALRRHPDQVSRILGQAVDEDHGFIAYNTALFHGGMLLWLQSGVELEHPVQILHIQTQPAAALTRHLIRLEAGARATVIESYAGVEAGLTAHVTEVVLAENAALDHVKIQEEHDRAFHFGGFYVDQADGARCRQTHFALGALLARSDIHARLGQGCETRFDGLHWADGRRHLDSHTRLIHARPDSVSREAYKAIAEQRGRSVFQGRIVVEPGAQRTDAEMNNRNLLLSDDAEIDTKPQLEIYADDVKCAHGVTVGQLDPDALFYLETRGIDQAAARQLLLYGFVNELIEQVGIVPLRAYLHRRLDDRFDAIELDEES